MSTAESELTEAIEAFCIGEQPHAKRLLVDNAAAISLLQDGATSWRTRDLKIRSRSLRWRVSSLDWKINFIPGLYEVAHVGTKPVVGQRLEALKSLMNMGGPPTEPKDDQNEDGKEATLAKSLGGTNVAEMKMALVMGLLAAQIRGAAADDPEEDDGEGQSWFLMGLLVYTAMVAIITLFGRMTVDMVLRRLWSYIRKERERLEVFNEAIQAETDGVRTSAQEGVKKRGAMERRNRGARHGSGGARGSGGRLGPGNVPGAGDQPVPGVLHGLGERPSPEDLRVGGDRPDPGCLPGADDRRRAGDQRGGGHPRDAAGCGEGRYQEGEEEELEVDADKSPPFSPASPVMASPNADGRPRREPCLDRLLWILPEAMHMRSL